MPVVHDSSAAVVHLLAALDIWKMLMVAEGRFRRLKAPELIEDVYLGAQYADGIAIESTAEMVAA